MKISITIDKTLSAIFAHEIQLKFMRKIIIKTQQERKCNVNSIGFKQPSAMVNIGIWYQC